MKQFSKLVLASVFAIALAQIANAVTLAEAIDMPGASLSGDWTYTSQSSYTGGYSAKSTNTGANTSSYMQLQVSGSGTLSFRWSVSSESGCDWLSVQIDGETQNDRISGSQSWSFKSYTISGSGTHTIRWEYSKDYSVNSGSDCGYVDCVQWVPAGPTIWYVDATNGNDSYNGRTSSQAKQTIQAAIDAAASSDTIHVAAGVYSPINVSKALTIIGAGAERTFIDGGNSSRCATFSGTSGYVLRGVTLRNGYSGSNRGGGAYYGTLEDCVITNCATLTPSSSCDGGGAYRSTLTRCTVVSCRSVSGGALSYCTARHCVLKNNRADDDGAALWNSIAYNCLVVGNVAENAGGGPAGGGAYYSTLYNCTVTGNRNLSSTGAGGLDSSCAYNCIIYGNSSYNSSYNELYSMRSTQYCTTSDPKFVNPAGGDYRLQINSPCIDAGTNSYVEDETDLAGNERIANGTVDIGCYEYGSSPVIMNGLIAWYKFDGNANDSSGNGNHGAVYGATLTTDRFGNSNASYSFEADYIEVPDSQNLKSVRDNVSVFAWVKPTSWDREWMTFLCKGLTARNIAFSFRDSRALETAASDVYVSMSEMVCLNEWQFVGYTSDGSTVKVFINGRCVGSRSISWNSAVNDSSLYIGKDPVGSLEYYYGAMDDLRIYNRALSEDEVRMLYSPENWSGPYTVRYNKNDGSGLTATQSINYGSSATLSWLDGGLHWTRSGYRFLGWSLSSSSSSVVYSNGQSVRNIASPGTTLDLYAVWEQTTYMVRFHKGAGTSTTRDQILNRDVSQNLYWMDSQIGWTVPGYRFGGWSRSATSTSLAYSNGANVRNLASAGGVVDLYAIWTPNIAPATALDVSGYSFSFSGSALWYAQSDVKYSGSSAMRSGGISDGQTSSMETNVEGPVEVSFMWKVSSEGNYDRLRFYVDDVEQNSISGDIGWTKQTVSLDSGSHTLKWTYSKDGSYSNGSDCGWVDQLLVRAVPYIVRYNKNDGTGLTATQSLPSGTFSGLLWLNSGLNWFYSGYSFLGWSLSATSSTIAYANGQNVRDIAAPGETVDLYAQWRANTYTVRFHKGAGTTTTANQTHTVGRTQNLTWMDSGLGWRVAGCTFAGWATYANGPVVYSNGENVLNLATAQGAVVHLYAVWNYTVTLRRNAGSGDTASTTVSLRYGSGSSLPWFDSGLRWSRTGYGFAGWSTAAGSPVSYANGLAVTNLVGATLYAQYTPNTYSVQFHRNRSSSDTTVQNQSFTYDREQGLKWLTGGLKWDNPNHDFRGWTTNASSTAVVYANGQIVRNLTAVNRAVVHLYALWRGKPYTVRFNKNDGSGAKMSQTFYYNEAQNLYWMDSQLRWSRTGYTFGGWARAVSSTTAAFSNGQRVTNAASIGATLDLYAIWTPITYTVVLNYNDGRSDLIRELPAVAYGSRIQLPWLDSGLKWSRVGYIFRGWSTSPSSKTVVHANGASVLNLASVNGTEVNLYAVWEAK